MIYKVVFFLFLAFAVFAFVKLKPKKAKSFPKAWLPILEQYINFYKTLSASEKVYFQKRIMLFLSEVYIEGVGTTIEDLDKVLIASSAVIPVFKFGDWHYNNLSGIIVYPDSFNKDLKFSADQKGKRILGMVGTGRFEKQMILSKKAIRNAFNNKTDKLNTPVHEFVHLLDKIDGETDGIPVYFLGKEYIQPWLTLMHKEMEAINNDESDIRKYGATSTTEFFAVASEYFFERPELFKRNHPELYKMLKLCFNT